MSPSVKALVPLKAHSERVPEKNFRVLSGRPLFHWILLTLSACRSVSEIIVDTDSDDIAREAKRLFGATILMRPEHLRGDEVSMNLLIESDISRIQGEHFLQTHSTNPLLTIATIDKAVEAYFAPGSHDSLFTVTPWRKRFYREDGTPFNHDPAHLLRTQDLPPLMEENSNLYLFSREGFARCGRRIGLKPLLFPMAPLEAIDIDDESDFQVTEYLMNKRMARS